MKKYISAFCLLFCFAILPMSAQNAASSVFTSVPVTNGKVVFQQFIHVDQELSDDQKYALLQKWAKGKFSGSPLLLGIRLDDKLQSVTVSAKVELPAGGEKIGMNYRFDAAVSNSGCMLTVRDVSYQLNTSKGASFFPKTYSAEEMITDQAINSDSEMKALKTDLRKSTLNFLNELYAGLSGVFQ
ncbi:hypothetical protein [Limibacterium fermenti]|uniref:hypothetical protein n=1 Tax=Limibacterium fermenti TaxID=3229863 RepID=UPI0026BE31D0